MNAKVFITYAHKDGPATNRFRQYIDDPLPPWAVDIREEESMTTPVKAALAENFAAIGEQIAQERELAERAIDECSTTLDVDWRGAIRLAIRAAVAQERERAERAEAERDALLASLTVAVESELGALWRWPVTAREQWMKDAKAAIDAARKP